jgi:hypothetical protein
MANKIAKTASPDDLKRVFEAGVCHRYIRHRAQVELAREVREGSFRHLDVEIEGGSNLLSGLPSGYEPDDSPSPRRHAPPEAPSSQSAPGAGISQRNPTSDPSLKPMPQGFQ